MKKIIFPIIFSLTVAACHADSPYHFLKQIPIGGEGGWDYLAVDSPAHRLYVSHATRVVVIDLNTDKIIGEITNTPGVHGVAIADNLGLGVVSIGRENKAGIVNLKTLQLLSKVDTAEGPDSYVYNPARKEAYIFCGRAQAATVVNVKAAKAVVTIPLGGRPEFATVDPEAGRVYDNLENKSEIAVIDTKTHSVIHHWLIAPGEGGSGMAIDVAHHRLFIGCHNGKMVMMNDTDGKVVATVPIGRGVDACRFDPATQLAFASCRDGTTTIAKEETPDKLKVVQVLKTERGARTMALDPTTHKIYLATAKFGKLPEAENGRRRRWRPPIVPGTFKILVYGTGK